MVRITEDLIRKKAEHNEKIIGTLEELSLHQEDIEKIENINNWCKDIQILLLQANLIPKIENLNKLKNLKYLNLALNNIETIENLNRCESLEKLDLTLNFIGNLQSIRTLKPNIHLKHLYLTGNPCCDFDGYREYVISALNQLETLDGKEITRSERIKAKQNIIEITEKIIKAENDYKLYRNEQIKRLAKNDYQSTMSDEEFWKMKSENAPETRIEISRRSRKSRNSDNAQVIEDKPSRQLFSKDGRPLNMNQAKLNFKLSDEDPRKFVLDLAIYRYLDTTLIDVDLQTDYVTVRVKNKIFQMTFPEEICIDKSTAKRSEITGHLVLEMPKANYKPIYKKVEKSNTRSVTQLEEKKIQFLDVKETNNEMDFSKIVENYRRKQTIEDNLDVPPLEFG